ncbi:MAG TPA: phospho-N-acetylmuramoyl-pentapeptide-transferase [Pirellulales bacterium]|nr:phospho-N-acetylmuramoyl-pentapeptide-transferase [Pirellulales bacterium]
MFFDPLTNVAGPVVRAALAGGVALVLMLIVMPWAIRRLRRLCTDTNASPSPMLRQLHAAKHATPSMGGAVIVAVWMLTVVVLADLRCGTVLLALVATAGMAAVGAVDDLRKRVKHGSGLSRQQKLAGQCVVAAMVAAGLAHLRDDGAAAWSMIPWATLVMVASANAVNLTDGLDGLAAGCSLWSAGALALMVVATAAAANRGELLVLLGALVGVLAGFLWFNRHPARVFMGDTGSLALGGLLGYLAIVADVQFLWPLVAGVFVVETLSVIAQVAWFRATQRRLLRCAPLHHHFQFLGWSEPSIVAAFRNAAACCAIVGVAASYILWPL